MLADSRPVDADIVHP